MNTCRTCKHRDFEGYCHSEKLAENYDNYKEEESSDMLLYSYAEDGKFWVGDNFGCVHHEVVK